MQSSTPERYPIRRLGGGIFDARLFERHKDDIERFLKRQVDLDVDADATDVGYLIDKSVGVQHQVQLPAQLPLTDEHMQPGVLYLGHDLASGDQLWLPLADFTHTLIAGETGSGKSTWTVSLIEGLRRQGKRVAHLYLCDLKQVEFAGYAARADNITVVDTIQDLFTVVTTVSRHDGRPPRPRQGAR